MADVFISYKAERKNAAEHLRHILEAHGFSVWYDYQLKTGTDFDLQIMRELNAAKAVVVLWDSLSVQSPWVKLEAMTARYNDTYVPVMIEDCVLATEFAKGQYEDLRKWSAEPAAFRPEGLIETLEEKLDRQAKADRATLKSLHEEWRKYGKQSLKQFALTAVPDKREAEKLPPFDLNAAALAASRRGELPKPVVLDDWSVEFQTIENSLNADDYRLFLSHKPQGPVAFRAARQLKQIENWDAVDQSSIPAVETFLGTHPFSALADSVSKHLDGLKIEEIERRRAEEARKEVETIVGRECIPPANTPPPISYPPKKKIEITEVRQRFVLRPGPLDRLVNNVRGFRLGFTSVTFSPDGRTVLTGSWDNTARLWSVETGETLHTLTGHKNSVWSVAFSPDGRTVLTGSWDNTARLWSVETGKVLHTPMVHEGVVSSVALGPGGRTFLTGSWDNTARLWDVIYY